MFTVRAITTLQAGNAAIQSPIQSSHTPKSTHKLIKF